MGEFDPATDPANPNPADPPAPDAARPDPDPKAKPTPARKRRRWPWVVGGVIVLLFLLVLIAPTLISSGVGRSILVSQINSRVNGRVEISSLSVGWTSGIRIDGLVVFDASGRQIMQLPHFSSGLTLLNAARGNYQLGRTEVDGLDVLVSREPDGSLNWEHLARSNETSFSGGTSSHSSAPSTSSASGGTSSSSPQKLPSVSGEIVLNSCSITYEDRSSERQPPVYLRSVQADVKIPDINQPITDSLSASAQVGSAPPGTIGLNGSLAAVKNNFLALASATVDQTLDIKGVDNGAIAAVLGPKLKLAGRSNGQVILQLNNGSDGAVQVLVQSNGFAAGGPQLNGATLSSDGLTFQLPRTAISIPQGIEHLETLAVKIGDGRTTALLAQLKNATLVQGEGAGARKVITGDTLSFQSALNYTSNAQGRQVQVTQLKLGDAQGIVAINKAGDEDVTANLPAAGNPVAQGKIDVAADLKRINDALQAMKGAQVVVTDPNGMELRSGTLKGQLAFSQADPAHIQLIGDFGVAQLTVGNATASPIQNEAVTLRVQAVSNHDLSQVQVPELKATGDLFTLSGTSIALKLSNGSDPKAPPVSRLGMLQGGEISVQAPSLPKLQALMRAFSPPPVAAKQTAFKGASPGPALAYAGPGAPAGAAPASQPAKPELPPADITSGSATLTLKISNDGHQLELHPGGKVTDLGLKRGDIAYTAGNIDLSGKILAMPAAPPPPGSHAPSLMEQLQEVVVAELLVDAPTLGTNVSLGEPIDIKNPSGLTQLLSPAAGAKPSQSSVTGRLRIASELAPLLALEDALAGEKSQRQMSGGVVLDERFLTDPSGAILTKGQADLSNLSVNGQANPETAFRVLNEVALSTAAKALDIRNLSIDATTTHAMALGLKGKILDLGGRQQIDNSLTADLNYDLAALWKVLWPLMTPEQQKSYKGVQIAGKQQKQFILSGAYPAGKAFNEAVQSLLVHGDLQVDHLADTSKGLDLSNADLPVNLKSGIARVEYFGKPEGQNLPQPIACNGGTIDLGGTAVDLRGQHMLVTTRNELNLMHNISLNPVLASWGLGDVLNNPLFVGASQASGQLNLLVHGCDGLPVDELGAPLGKAIMELSIGSLQLGTPQMASTLPKNVMNSLRGEVPAYHVTIDRGMLNQDFTFVLLEHKRPIHLTGQVNLATKQMLSTTLELPWSLFAVGDKNLQKYLPDGIQIPFTGQSDSPIPALDVNQIMQKYVAQAGQKYLQDQLLGKNKNDPNANGNPSANQDPAAALENMINKNNHPDKANNAATQPADQDPLKAIGDLFNKKKKK